MKILKYFFAVTILVCLNSSLLSQWITQNSYDSIKTINSSFFIYENTGWLSGNNGRISKTSSGGLFWQTIFIDYNTNFYSIKFINQLTGFVCGNNGKIYKTNNGGDNWYSLNINNSDTLCSIDFADLNTGWCIGYHSILKTTNQGNNWIIQNHNISAPLLRLNTVKMYNSMNGLIGGINLASIGQQNSYIFRTTNGGVNWNIVDSLFLNFVESICYLNQQIVFLSTWDTIYKSFNGGVTWTANFHPTEVSVTRIKFLDINTGWFTRGNSIYKTTNQGDNWFVSSSIYSLPLIGFDCFNSGVQYATQYKGEIYKSSNGGINWCNFSCDSYNYLISVWAFDENRCIVTGGNGTLAKTTDGGYSWKQKFRDNIEYINKLFFINNSTGWCITLEKSLMKTTNAGENWSVNSNKFPQTPNNIYCIDANNFWVVGDSGLVLKTTNSGQNWINLSPNPILNFRWIKSFGNNVLLQGDSSYTKNLLFRSTNSGYNWYQIFFDSLDNVHFSISFLNDQTGWVFRTNYTNLSYAPVFYKTTNGGNNWIKNNFYSQGQGLIGNFVFLDDNTGYASTWAPEIIKTTNGGFNWFVQINQLPEYVVDVSFINPFTGWAIGMNGGILKTTNGGSTYINNGITPVPQRFLLYQNYPNPFNPTTKIKFEIKTEVRSQESEVKLVIYDILGKEIVTLVNEKLNPGTYEVTFDGSNYASGVYFYQLRAGEFIETKKLILLK